MYENTGSSKAPEALNTQKYKPLTGVNRDIAGADGLDIGASMCNPEEVDHIVIRAWNHVYKGNVKPMHEVIAKCPRTYANDILTTATFQPCANS